MAGMSSIPSSLPSTGGTPLESVIPATKKVQSSDGSSLGGLFGRLQRSEDERKKSAQDAVERIEKTPFPTAPKLLDPPKPENYNHSPMQTFGSAAMFLASFGSLLTKRPLLSALKSGTAVMNAYHQQDATAFKQAFDTWKIDTENAKIMHDYQMDLYKDMLNKPIEEQKILAAVSKDETTKLAIEGKFLQAQIKAIQGNGGKVTAATAKNEEVQRRIDEGEDPRKAFNDVWLTSPAKSAVDVAPTWTPAAIEKAADAVAGGVRLNIAAPGMGKNNPNRDAVMNKLAEKYPNVNLAEIERDYAGDTSEKRAIGTAAGKLKLSANLLDKAILLARDAIEKVDLSEFLNINQLENAVRKRTGNKELAAAYTALQTVMSDYSALIARNGTSTDATRAAARDLVNENMSKGQLNSVFDQMELERDNVIEAVKETKNPSKIPTVKTPEEFDALDSGDEFIEDGVKYRKP